MPFLYDENLPRALVKELSTEFPNSLHVADLDLLSAGDDLLWKAAEQLNCAIVSKDQDFFNRAVVEGARVKVVWMRIGNCSRSELVLLLRSAADQLDKFLEDPEGLIFVLPPGVVYG